MKHWMLWGLLACSVLPSLTSAAESPVETRKAIFKKMLRSFEPMGLMVREREPYRKEVFLRHATALNLAAREPWAHFPAGSTQGKNRAKPDVWTKPVQFKAEQETFIRRVEALKLAADKGRLQEVAVPYAEVQKSCKSCHDSFRVQQTGL